MNNNQTDINTPEGQKILKEGLQKIQSIDNQTAILKEERKAVLKSLKEDGLESGLVNKAITEIRKLLDTEEDKLIEQDFYQDLIEEFEVVKSVK